MLVKYSQSYSDKVLVSKSSIPCFIENKQSSVVLELCGKRDLNLKSMNINLNICMGKYKQVNTFEGNISSEKLIYFIHLVTILMRNIHMSNQSS